MSRPEQTVWWHVYPLGFTGAPVHVREPRPMVHRLPRLTGWLDHVVDLGCTGLLLGPVFASHTHGYDTVDHLRLDPRLGDESDLDALIGAAHARGVRVMLDGVFNHVGRGFPMFERALADGPGSEAARWFRPCPPVDGAPVRYETFEGHDSLVTLNHDEPAVAEYVTRVIDHWLDRGVDGWRMDAAYAVPAGFWRPVLDAVRVRHPRAWFVGEMIHGDYVEYVEASGLDSVTQYELWKAIWSGLNDVNLFEVAWALERHDGFCRAFDPLTFVGNHDVTRIASRLTDRRLLGHALALLLTLPGVPCVYAGDEFALTGVKEDRAGGDDAVRPAFPDHPEQVEGFGAEVHRRHRELIAVRRRLPWLARARVSVPYLKNEAAAVVLTPGDGSAGQVTLLLALDGYGHGFPADLGTGTVLAGDAPVPDGTDPAHLGPHSWRVLASSLPS